MLRGPNASPSELGWRTVDDEALQELLDGSAAKCGVIGAQMAIFDRGRLREFATGWRNWELRLPVTADTLFQIGSTTKVFNASLVMSLVDSGKLALDVPVREYLRDLRLASWEAQHSVTLQHLLSMSAGMDNGFYHDYGRGDEALGRYVVALAGLPHLFKPGTAFGYSNASTNVAGHAAATVMGRSWEELLAERIIDPLSLHSTALFAEDLLAHPVALGYTRGDTNAAPHRVRGWALPRSCAPAGGTLSCSAGDLVRFARMFLDRGAGPEGRRVLSTSAVDNMHAPQVELPTRLMAQQWCCGPYRKIWDGAAVYGHSGTNVGGSSMLLWCPEKQIAIATVVNVAAQGYPLAERIFDVVFPELFGIQKPRAPAPEAIEPLEIEDPGRLVGRFEAFGTVVQITWEGGRLLATEDSDLNRMYGIEPVTRSELIPLGGDRFFPRNPALSGNRLWDVAFWDESQSGRATHYLGGLFAFRRTA